jgi:RNA polymerase sigma-70 factor
MSERTKSTRFFSLYTAIQPRLYAFLLMIVHHHHKAEEILQETAIVLWEQFDRYREGTDFGAWAITIAKYKAFAYLKENKKHDKLFKTDLYEQLSEIAEPSSVDISDRITALEACLWKLKKTQRDLLSLRYKKDMQISEIARLRNVAIASVYHSMSRLFTILRKCIRRTLSHGNPV